MKKLRFSGTLAIVFMLSLYAVIFTSCVTTEGVRRPMNEIEQENYEVLGPVLKDMNVGVLTNTNERLDKQAYVLLLKEAQKTYGGDIDVRDISFVAKSQGFYIFQDKFTVYGKVVRLKS